MTARCKSHPPFLILAIALLLASACGCGTTKAHTATDQLLLSDAVDRSVSGIDFRPLSGKNVYLDATYLQPVKGLGFVNSDYIISSLRQQILAAGCQLQEERKDAELIIEARVGTLGSDGYQVSYGLPASNILSTASSLLPQAPPVPSIPELSLARRESDEASAKIAAFAYDRETRKAVWQSGISRSESDSRETWVLGVGPFESGTIRENMRLAGKDLPTKSTESDQPSDPKRTVRPEVDYASNIRFNDGYPILPGQPVQPDLIAEAGDTLVLDASDTSELKQVSFEEAEKRTKE